MSSSNVPLHASATLDVPEQIVQDNNSQLISLSHNFTIVVNRCFFSVTVRHSATPPLKGYQHASDEFKKDV